MPLDPSILVWTATKSYSDTKSSTQTVDSLIGTIPAGSYGVNPMLIVAYTYRYRITSDGCFDSGSATPSIRAVTTSPSDDRSLASGGGGTLPGGNPNAAGGVVAVAADSQFNLGADVNIRISYFVPGSPVESQVIACAALIADTVASPTQASNKQFAGLYDAGSGAVVAAQITTDGNATVALNVTPATVVGVGYGARHPSTPATTIDESTPGWYHINSTTASGTDPGINGQAYSLRAALGAYLPQTPPQNTGTWVGGIPHTAWYSAPICFPTTQDFGWQAIGGMRIVPPAVVANTQGRVMVVG